MTFDFNLYSSPLLFGFVQGWIYAALLWIRARREERLSDWLLGWVLVGLSLNIWEYMLGFGGIEILWRELEFFPRTLGYLFPALCYFYLKSQVNADFRFTRQEAWHALPFLIQVTYHIGIFSMGHEFVERWKTTVQYPYHLDDLEFIVGIGLDVYYLILSLRLYRHYRAWIKTQFSETETISFLWFRNFLITLTATMLFSLFMTFLSLLIGLDFWQNWWDELAGVALIYYVSIHGYAQAQPGRRLTFEPVPVEQVLIAEPFSDPVRVLERESVQINGRVEGQSTKSLTGLPTDLVPWRDTLLTYMDNERPYLDPDLSLIDLARRLKTNASILSPVINAGTGKNFNDFVNQYRVDAFKRQVLDPANSHLSLLGIALDCGFNSKATFNRAFKKLTSQSPREFVESRDQ
ncbi:helix-turn-helix domain-containing protein [Spirosoma pollinicola]|uniref:AraC family transcriptional regulator n=1 Tax=Spirosoma pollinicola TaxID=2057025 RepID=A0A2K8YVC5_9BACT|nr:AraC family transcriptional regulator [Spirosoma pollinicola]AUD01534.1 AraC family transcriptional regulator [Spirosoma pollinicola]